MTSKLTQQLVFKVDPKLIEKLDKVLPLVQKNNVSIQNRTDLVRYVLDQFCDDITELCECPAGHSPGSSEPRSKVRVAKGWIAAMKAKGWQHPPVTQFSIDGSITEPYQWDDLEEVENEPTPDLSSAIWYLQQHPLLDEGGDADIEAAISILEQARKMGGK